MFADTDCLRHYRHNHVVLSQSGRNNRSLTGWHFECNGRGSDKVSVGVSWMSVSKSSGRQLALCSYNRLIVTLLVRPYLGASERTGRSSLHQKSLSMDIALRDVFRSNDNRSRANLSPCASAQLIA